MIACIVCVDKNWGIGYKGNLLFKLKKDMQFFKEKTTEKSGTYVIMGYNTCLSLPDQKPLANRMNLVLCPDCTKLPGGFLPVYSFEELLQFCKTYENFTTNYYKDWSDTLYIIGGAMMYKSMLPYCDKVYVTKVDAEKEADTFFPNLDTDTSFELIEESEPINDNGYKIKFTTYINNNKQSL